VKVEPKVDTMIMRQKDQFMQTVSFRRFSWQRHGSLRALALAAVVMALAGVLAGCATTREDTRLQQATAEYEQGAYEAAYRTALPLSQTSGPQREAGAYVAGLAAWKHGRRHDAVRLLTIASRSRDASLAADANASLGMVYAELGQYASSARHLMEAAKDLQGQHRANAYYYTGIAQQKLGQHAQARTSFSLARNASQDANFRRQVEDQLSVTGYTLQIGAFRQRDNAMQAAERIAAQASQLRLGAPRIVDSTDQRGNTIYQVQLGQFTTYQSALDARQRLGQQQAIVVFLRSN